MEFVNTKLDALPASFGQLRAMQESQKEFEIAWRKLLSMNLNKTLKDFKLTISFKTLVNLENTRRFAKLVATTTTTSKTTRCESAASELPKVCLRCFEACGH